ncbi:MAG: THxN family PEP-CTERM protein [Betaproteobacteria bacterium]
MRVLRILAVAGLTVVTSVANAAIVTQWSYQVTSSFVTASTVFSAGGGTTTNTTSLIAWGIPFGQPNQSSLEITGNPATGLINTTTPPFSTPLLVDGEIGPTQTFTHNNFPIEFSPNQSALLLSTQISTTLDLKPNIPNQPDLGPFPSITFGIKFKETLNGGPCPVDAPPCPDIFVLEGNFNPFTFSYDTDGAGPDPAQLYFVQIFPLAGTPLSPLSDAACAAAGSPNGCIGFITQENQSNHVQFAFALTTEPFGVPEPGVLALFALGLVGLGFTVRRRQV